jgi:hypothetical protein
MTGGGAAVHEATALWDVKTAVDSEAVTGHGEELLRCARASRARKKLSRKGR